MSVLKKYILTNNNGIFKGVDDMGLTRVKYIEGNINAAWFNVNPYSSDGDWISVNPIPNNRDITYKDPLTLELKIQSGRLVGNMTFNPLSNTVSPNRRSDRPAHNPGAYGGSHKVSHKVPKIHIGPLGGKYVIKNGKKKYLA